MNIQLSINIYSDSSVLYIYSFGRCFFMQTIFWSLAQKCDHVAESRASVRLSDYILKQVIYNN